MLWMSFQPMLKCLDDEQIEKVRAAAPEAVLGAGGFYSLTIAQWNRLTTHKDLSVISDKMLDPLKCNVFEYYTLEELPKFIDKYIKQLERFTLKPDAAEEAAQQVCFKVSPTEGLLLFAREYFGLHSFADAEKVTLGELLLAKKDTYNKQAFQKAYSKQLNNKHKR